MTGYTTEEVARLLGLSTGQIRSYTRAGFLSPSSPPRPAGGARGFVSVAVVPLRAGGAAVFLSGPGAAARSEGPDGGPDPRGEDPRLAAPLEAAAAAGTGALGAAHYGRRPPCGGAGRRPRLESGFGAAGARFRRGEPGRARGPAGASPGSSRAARGGRSRRRAVVRLGARARSEGGGGRARCLPAGGRARSPPIGRPRGPGADA